MKKQTTFGWICRLILVDSSLDVTEGGRRSTLLQDADGITKLVCKLDTYTIQFRVQFRPMNRMSVKVTHNHGVFNNTTSSVNQLGSQYI